MRGRPAERKGYEGRGEAELHGPGGAEGGVGVGDQRALRPGGRRELQHDPRALQLGGGRNLPHGGREQYAGRSGEDETMEDPELRDQRLWEAACRRTKSTSQTARDLAPLKLDWIWNDEHKVWVPERARQAGDELISDMELVEEMENNYMKACRTVRGMEKQREYLFEIIKGLRSEVRKWQAEAAFWKEQHDQKEAERFVTPRKRWSCLRRRWSLPMCLRCHRHRHHHLRGYGGRLYQDLGRHRDHLRGHHQGTQG